MGDQVLPLLTQVIYWYDLSILMSLWEAGLGCGTEAAVEEAGGVLLAGCTAIHYYTRFLLLSSVSTFAFSATASCVFRRDNIPRGGKPENRICSIQMVAISRSQKDSKADILFLQRSSGISCGRTVIYFSNFVKFM